MGIDEDYANDIIIKEAVSRSNSQGFNNDNETTSRIVYHKIRRIQ